MQMLLLCVFRCFVDVGSGIVFQEATLEEIFADACFQSYLVTLRIKSEMVNDEMRLKNAMQRVVPVDMKTECEALLDAISKYN